MNTGVDIEIRAGGPAIGNQSVVSTMYQDPSIMLGYVDTDQAVQTSKQFPTTAVMASVDISHQMITAGSATYPQVTKIADLKATGASVLYFQGTHLDGLRHRRRHPQPRSQVDGSYDGTPPASSPPRAEGAAGLCQLRNRSCTRGRSKAGKKPVKYQLVNDIPASPPTSPRSPHCAAPDVEKYSDCLKQFVPVMQRVWWTSSPTRPRPAKVILDAVKRYDTGWVYTSATPFTPWRP